MHVPQCKRSATQASSTKSRPVHARLPSTILAECCTVCAKMQLTNRAAALQPTHQSPSLKGGQPRSFSLPLLRQSKDEYRRDTGERRQLRLAVRAQYRRAASAAASGSTLARAVETLQSRLRAAVLAEETEQQRQRMANYSRASVQRLANEGLALFNLQATPQGRQVAQTLVLHCQLHFIIMVYTCNCISWPYAGADPISS